ncbi:retention module-containing protein [Pontibacterium sp.]|uniref:retention module-containing protein n=1 Tax=Pontibacterium sp. TaxID=2036026 RepID=UPI0035163603
MADQTPIATVAAITGEAFIRDSSDQLRALDVGQHLQEGDAILPSEGGRVDLVMTDGAELAFTDPVEIALNQDMLVDRFTVVEDNSIVDSTVTAVLQALESGQDPFDVIQPPAAGPEGHGGRSFTVLNRIEESINELTFDAQGITSFFDPLRAEIHELLKQVRSELSFDLTELFLQSDSSSEENAAAAQQSTSAPDPEPVASAPFVANDSDSTNEDVAVAIDVLVNDSDVDGDLDPTSVTITSGPSNGSVSVNPTTGVVTYTPDADYHGADSFTYTVDDLAGNTSSPASVSLTVNPVADDPVSVNDSDSTNEDVAVAIDVLANDSDVDGDLDPTSVVITADPSNGSVSVNPTTGVVTYTPDADYNGADSFSYTVDDLAGNTSSPAIVILTVNPVADDPVSVNDAASTNEDVAVAIDVLANDSDVDGDLDPTSVVITSGPSNGSVAVNPTTGVVTYTPDADYNGADSFSYTVDDLAGNTSSPATVSLTVNPVADDPVTVNDSASTNEDVAVAIDVLANDSDVDGDLDPTSVVITAGPSHGSVSVNPTTGVVTYTPDADYHGADSFSYTVDDLAGNTSSPATVSLTVNPVNDAPVAVNDSETTDQNTAITIDVMANDSDPESDPIDIDGFTQPAQGTVTQTLDGTFVYTPNGTFIGQDSFTYTIKDDSGEVSNTATVIIDVTEDHGVTLDFTASSGATVYDVGLLSVGDTSETVNSSFKVVAQDGLASLTIAGITFTAAQLAAATGISPLTVVSNADEELVITGYDAGTGNVSYSYTLLNPVDHAVGSDTDSVSFVVTATDTDGDTSAAGSLIISQEDDAPEILSVAGASGLNGVGQILGAIDLDSSADTAESFSWGSVTTSVNLYVGGEAVIISTDDASKTVTGKLADDTTVFTLTLDANLSTYTYQQFMAIDTNAEDIGITAGMTGNNNSDYRESSNGLAGDPIQTLFYGYEYSSGDSAYARSTVSMSANKLGVGTGQDIDADNNKEDQLLLDFDKNVKSLSLQVDISGVGTADLRYTVYTDRPAELANLGVDGFTYTALPAGGHSNVVTVSGDDTLTINASDFGLGAFTFIVFEADDGDYKLVADQLTVDYESDSQDFSISAGINVTDNDQDVDSDSIDINISATLSDLTGDVNGNALGGDELANTLDGQAGDDQLSGNAGDDTLIGGSGDDTLVGGLGSDTFVWQLNDGGAAGTPATDTITDFDSTAPASGGDKLDLSSLLVGEDGGDLTHFLHFELDGSGDTVIKISTDGDFAGGFSESDVEQVIVQEGVDLVTAYTSGGVVDQSALISDLVTNGTLVTDV